MIKDFETVKDQLKELSEVINSFNSETVQLKIIEMLLKGPTKEEDSNENEPEGQKVQTKRRKRKNGGKPRGEGEKRTPSSKGKPGPTKTIDQLVSDDFFKTKKSIGAIVKYCNDSLAITLKSTDISGTLMKLVRDRKLKREKNSSNGQYEYINY